MVKSGSPKARAALPRPRRSQGLIGRMKDATDSAISWCDSAIATTRFRANIRSLSCIGSSLAPILVLFVVSPPPAHAGTKCKCNKHNAEAEAGGTCSRTEDSSYCSLKFSATPPVYRKVFLEFLEKVQNEVEDETNQTFRISLDISETLNFARRTDPSDWKEPQIVRYLPVLFAMSQRETFSGVPRPGLSDDNYRFRQATFEVTKFIVKNTDDILKGWKDPDTMSDNAIAFRSRDGIPATISYGCIEVTLGEVDTMVKTKFSLGGYGCADTEPDLYSLHQRSN